MMERLKDIDRTGFLLSNFITPTETISDLKFSESSNKLTNRILACQTIVSISILLCLIKHQRSPFLYCVFLTADFHDNHDLELF